MNIILKKIFYKKGLDNYYVVPPSPANFIWPGKQPMSSMTPIIAVDRETKKGLINKLFKKTIKIKLFLCKF